jgi:hypothetical protein
MHEMDYLPAIYMRRVARRQAKQRMRAILAAKAKEKRNTTSGSLGTAGTGDTHDTVGRLGDCDDDFPAGGTTGGSRTPQREKTPGELNDLLRRALDLNPTRNSRSRSGSASRNAPRAKPGPPSVSMNVETSFERSRLSLGDRSKRRPSLFSGDSGTGNSVAGPRPSGPPSSARPSQSPAPSSGPQTSSGGLNSSAGGSTPRPPSSVGSTNSTVRAIRNAPLGGRIFSGPGNDTSSLGTTHVGDFETLLSYDDSPLLRTPTDIYDAPLENFINDQEEMFDVGTENIRERGRVVTVRLHKTEDGLPKFTPGAIANRVFGGLVQEFQLHPGQRTALVVFMHPIEARSFVHHFKNVREKGTLQEIRELQIEVSWYQ